MTENNQELTLIIMAAGMGSRYGGLKQIEPVGPNGEFIIDYSVYDAKKAGFTKIVFIIKKEIEDIFKQTIGARIEGKIDVSYVIQDMNNLPIDIDLNNREKPLGTAHAIYCCKGKVTSPFAIINADDFYGYDAYVKMADFLKNNPNQEYSLMGYRVKNTLTENGSVKRGICKEENKYLTSIIESKIEKIDNKIIASPLDGRNSFEIENNQLVSMNMLGFTPDIFPYLEEKVKEFLTSEKTDLTKDETLIPCVVEEAIEEDRAKVKVLETTATWYGVTYKEDKEYVVNGINSLIESGEYPKVLWNN
jgi:UTP-glucose-1-phosphate uridylyltransferase